MALMALDIGRRELARRVTVARRAGRALPQVVIVGAGLSGLAMAMQMVRAGHRDFLVLEQSDGVGGTWRDNSYPGSGCDVPSHLYSFSFAPKCDWSRRFAEQPEILSYAEQCVADYGLSSHLRLRTAVNAATFDENRRRWSLECVTVDGGPEVIDADVLVFACGQLNRPHVPELPGLDTFAGPRWHSARWDHAADLSGARVAVIGNGASAIQFVPPVAAQAAEVTVFQRTPNYVAPKRDRVYGPLVQSVLKRVRPIELLYRWWIYWSLESRWLWFRKDSWASRTTSRLFAKGIQKGVVSDRLPADAVVPDYPIGCKRVLISSDWYPTLLRPNVTLVDSPIDRVEADAVRTADGVRHPADVLVFATGFATTQFLAHIPVRGLGGRQLADEWEDGAHAYLGTMVAGFPDCYLLYGPNTNLGHNSILFMVERQVNLVLQALALQLASEERAEVGGVGGDRDRASVDVDPVAYRADDERTQARLADTAWVAGCRSWYKDASGRVVNNWPTWTVRYWYDTLRLRRSDVRLLAHTPPGQPDGAGSTTTAAATRTATG
jgi:cation diffusion facilitator CzcD-associated flavoprotein CzcO